jgi:Cu+-exporting ATPase
MVNGQWSMVNEAPLAPRPSPLASELLRIAASAEKVSEHPLAEAIVERAKQEQLALSEPQAFDSLTGRGVMATVDGHAVLLGSPALMTERGIEAAAMHGEIQRLQDEGKTVMAVAVDGALAGLIAVADTVKRDQRRRHRTDASAKAARGHAHRR